MVCFNYLHSLCSLEKQTSLGHAVSCSSLIISSAGCPYTLFPPHTCSVSPILLAALCVTDSTWRETAQGKPSCALHSCHLRRVRSCSLGNTVLKVGLEPPGVLLKCKYPVGLDCSLRFCILFFFFFFFYRRQLYWLFINDVAIFYF